MPKAKTTAHTTNSKTRQEGGGGVTKVEFKPRHGLRMTCKYCGWRFIAGGYITKKQRDAAEFEQKKIHQELHRSVKRPVQLQESEVNTEQLQIERDTHAAEIGHFFLDKTSEPRSTLASTTYTDVAGVSIAATNFTASQDHLVIVTAKMDMADTSNVGSIRMVRGTTPTVIADSEMAMENGGSTGEEAQRCSYNWWGIINTNPAELLKMQFKSSSATIAVGVDLIAITVIKLSPDLTVNTDYKTNLNPTTTNISAFDTDTSTNNASVNITPSSANHKWLILSKARFATGILNDASPQSRIERSGVSTSSVPVMQMEGEDGTLDQYVFVGMRTDTLTAASHTYTEISKLIATPATGVTPNPASAARTHSGIFMMDLDKFKHVATLQEDTAEDITVATATTSYGYQVHTQSITPAQTGDICILGFATVDAGGSGTEWRMRMQVDNTDQPAAQTTKAFDYWQYTTEDRIPILFNTNESLSAVAHTIDIDASITATSSGNGTYSRNITAFSMEMGSAAITATSSADVVGITEVANRVLGKQITKISSDTVGITESVGKTLGTSTNFLTPSNFQLRYSGGSANSNPDASIGGAMSSVVVGTRLFDHVTIAEAAAGDATPDHRCIYIINTHTTLAMDDVKIWFAANTQGDDYVEMGLGNSAVGTATSETAIANEGTAPSPAVTFTLAASEATAITISSIPALNHKAIWIRRTVPAGTNSPVSNNQYMIMAKFLTNHV